MKAEMSYWPENLTVTEPVSETTPGRFLRESARELSERTGGLLRAEVEEGSWGEYLVYDFVIVAPALDDYAYRLFKVRHKLAPFPAEFIFEGHISKAATPEAFEGKLRTILAAPATRRAVAELVQYSRGRTSAAA